MKRFLLTTLAVLFLSGASFAQDKQLPNAPIPKPQDTPSQYHYTAPDPFWQTHRPSDKHFWLINTEAYASTLAPLIGGLHCRRVNGVEPCTEHYGAFYQGWAWGTGIEVAAGTAIYHMCRKDNHNSKKCDFIQHVVTGINLGWGVHEALIRTKRD